MSTRTLLLTAISTIALAAPAVAQAAPATSCSTLSGGDFQRLGEQAMKRLAGSATLYAAMDRRMDAVMGTAASAQMYEVMGRRWAGCAPGGAMMGGVAPSWMRDGSWRSMNRSQWSAAQRSWMGASMMRTGTHLGTAGIVGIVIGAVALGALAMALLVRRRGSQPGAPSPTG